MFFSDRTSSAALTVLFAGTEKKPACFFISSNCFAVFVGLSIAFPLPRFLFTLPCGLQTGPLTSLMQPLHSANPKLLQTVFGWRLLWLTVFLFCLRGERAIAPESQFGPAKRRAFDLKQSSGEL